MFHIGWFLTNGMGVQGWGTQDATTSQLVNWTQPDVYIDLARELEKACFDYLMIEDSLMVSDTYRGTMEYSLAHGAGAPKNDPMPMVPLIAQATSKIGIIATMATSFYPPFTAARLGATLDHLTKGRVGINIVTASSHRSAQNYGLDQHIEHDERYLMADEWMQVCYALWSSWESGAVVVDRDQGVFADFSKVHTIDFKGKYYSCRGPLNTAPGPQGRPVICQAGGSSAGRSFASRHADTIVANVTGIDKMKAYRADIAQRMIAAGRNPKTCKVLFLTRPIVADTDESANEIREQRCAAEDKNLDGQLAHMSYLSGIDMSQFDPDEPLPDLSSRINGHQSSMADFAAGGKTLREMAAYRGSSRANRYVGSYDTVAGLMGEVMEEVGGDGFLIGNPVTKKSIAQFSEGLAPALKRRGLIRSGYSHKLFRDNLLEF
jgi:FMN-dependent oxidoreductase (nitrilotriacetate monooxygenase family)